MGGEKKKLCLVVIIASNQKQSLHRSILAPQHFTSAFFSKHTRETLFLNQPIAQVLYQPSSQIFPTDIYLKDKKSFIRLTLENFWSLQKNNSHRCNMAHWPRPWLYFKCPKSQWWFALTACSIQLPLLMLHSVILLPGCLLLYCTAG